MVLTELKVVIDIGMPRFKIDCEGTSTLATTLVNIASSVIEDFEHGNQPV
jgi:hypothetical protein